MTNLEALSPWLQRIRLDDGDYTPGRWDVEKQASFIKENAPWPLAGRALDAGGNAGGIALNLQDCFDEILVLETSAINRRQFEYVAGKRDVSRLEYESASLFTAHTKGAFDFIMMLGLVYHFRHPQLFLDYCAQLDAERFIFSTQIAPGDNKILWNRSQIKAYSGRGLLGWHPSKSAFAEMLEAAGFRVDRAIDVDARDFTNNHYVFCTKTKPKPLNIEAAANIANGPGFWF